MTEPQGSKIGNWYRNYHSDDPSRRWSTEAPPPPAQPSPPATPIEGREASVLAELTRQTDHLEAIRRYVGILLAIVIIQIVIAFIAINSARGI